MSPGTYREYQTVFELREDTLASVKPRKVTKRSFSGCLNCKRKRIKCDETKEKCRNCARSSLQCKWPSQKDGTSKTVDFMREPNAGLLPSTLAPGSGGSPFLVNQELSHSRSILGEYPPSTVSSIESDQPTPRCNSEQVSIVHESSGSKGFSPSRQPFGSSPESGLFETLGKAFVQASTWVDFSEFRDMEDAKKTLERTSQADIALSSQNSDNSSIESVALHLSAPQAEQDSFFLSQFVQGFLPTIAQVNFQDQAQFSQLVLTAAKESELLQEVFIACGASIVAFNHAQYRAMAHERYTKAINHYLNELKHGAVKGGEAWFFVAVQVLQTLCLRDTFADANATRCAAHFGAAYKIISLRLSGKGTSTKPFSELEKIMIENFLFNYSITIFFCDHKQLPQLVPSPFVFFHRSRGKLVEIFYDSKFRYKYRSMLAFQIAAKSSWSCRLKLPLDEEAKLLHMELLQLAEALHLSFENDDELYSHPNERVTTSIAKVVLQTSMILLQKMIDYDNVKAEGLQHLVQGIRADISRPHNESTIFPIWSLMIAASTSTSKNDRDFFRDRLDVLLTRSKSRIIVQILNHLDGLWELYKGDEPFELLFDTTVLDEVCN
ncbi:hypothetical protein OXX59_001653 [Metschnikowia pulcherrima]